MSVQLNWLGQGGYWIRCGETAVCLDPYLSFSCEEHSGHTRIAPPPLDPASIRADLFVFSHDHMDHLDEGTLRRIDLRHNRFAGPDSCLNHLRRLGVPEENLPDPASLPFDSYILDGKLYQKGATVQDLLDNGWVLPADHPADTTVEAGGISMVYGDRMYLYNGAGLVYVGAFNYSSEECTLAECSINEIKASVLLNGALICADGIQPGVTALSEAAATLGAPSEDSTDEDGVRTVEFEVLNGVTYELTVDADELVTAIAIKGLQG